MGREILENVGRQRGGEEDLKEGEIEGANPPREEPKNEY